MRLLAIGPCQILDNCIHEVFRCEPTLYRILAEVNSKGIEVVCSEIELPASITQRLRENRIPLIGETLWASALRDSTYQVKLLCLLEACGIRVQNGQTASHVELVGWWNGLTSNFHYLRYNNQRSLDKNRGPVVPSAWSVNLPLRLQSALVRRVTEPLYPFLSRSGHVGPFSLGLILKDDDIAVVRVSAGFQGDSDVAALEVLDDPLLFLLQTPALMRKGKLDAFASLHVMSAASSIEPLAEAALRHVHLSLDSREAIVTARGQDWREASRRLYRTVSRIQPDTIQYRSDLGLGFPELHSSLLRLALL